MSAKVPRPGAGERRIVVGYDGSRSALRALEWAKNRAAATGTAVDAVIAWQLPATYGWAGYATERELARWADRELSEAVARVLDTGPYAPVHEHVRCGNAARVLLDMAEGAELLVLGSHGRGGFARVLIGSVAAHCVRHAPCPVVVVRAGRDAARTAAPSAASG
ncbi:universal stress protein [Streptomyces sp. NPDC047002]|uniref:universal stress protein n=1 Tax=Streptomyces sp. NPDC047002 TaxID=3155475 RepID=UPI0034560619